jgi:hypothetical protein
MGKENFIRTGTNNKSSDYVGVSSLSNNLRVGLPSSTFDFGVVVSVDTVTREIRYNVIEDNLVTGKLGLAKPLYKNKIQLPDVGYVVPLLRGPDTNIQSNGGQYSKTTYYLDPININQTVNQNKVEKRDTLSPSTSDVRIDKNNIKNANLGIPINSPSR